MGKMRKRMRYRSRGLQGAGAEVEERGVERVVELRRLQQRLGNRQRHLVKLGRRWLKKTTTMRMMKTKMWSCLMTMMTTKMTRKPCSSKTRAAVPVLEERSLRPFLPEPAKQHHR